MLPSLLPCCRQATRSSALRRLRPDNTYLLLDDFGESGAEDTGLTTELGVMSNEEEEQQDQQARLSCPCIPAAEDPLIYLSTEFTSPAMLEWVGRSVPDMWAAWQGKSAPHFGRQGGEIDRKFSLGEEDVDSAPPARTTGVSQPQSRSRNNTA